MRRLFATFLTLTLFAAPQAAFAQRTDGIAAVVNNDVITLTELNDRIDMISKSSGMPQTEEFRKKIMPQILDSLVSETVQIQEAKRLDMLPSDQDIDAGFAKIAEQNKATPDKFLTFLKGQGIQLNTMKRQLTAQIAWNRVIQQHLRSQIVIGDSDIEAERTRIAASAGKTEYQLAEIFLPVQNDGEDAKTRATALRLIDELKKGQPFPAIARQFSRAASAAANGSAGWVTQGQLQPALDEALSKMAKDQLSDPIRGDDGYYIFYVRDLRVVGSVVDKGSATLSIRELVLRNGDMNPKEIKEQATVIARDLTGCLDIAKKAADNKALKLVERTVSVSDLGDGERTRLENLPIGQAADPVVGQNSTTISMVCSKTAPTGGVTDEMIERRLGTQRLDMLQKRYLRDLVSSAFVERRV